MVLATIRTDLEITAEELTPAAFAPFGGVISSKHQLEESRTESANYGTATKLFKVSPIANNYANCPSGKPATANWNMFRCTPPAHLITQDGSDSLYTSKVLERHPFSTQTFVPMGRDKAHIAYMVIVAPTGEDGLPVVAETRAFVARGDQAVTYGVATWHAPMIALGETVDFAVLVHENEVPDDDCQETYLETLTVRFPTTLSTNAASAPVPRRRKSQSQDAWERELDQFHNDGPVNQERGFLDNVPLTDPESKMDINRIKYAAERQYYLRNYRSAAKIIEDNIGAAKGKMVQDLLVILNAAKHRM